MKQIILMACMLAISTFLFASTPPEAVTKAFNQKFPSATHVKWDKENAHEYEASFEWKGVNYSANFSDLGLWLEIESPSSLNQLPEKVQTSFNATHKGAKVKAVAKIETSKGITKFEIEIKQGNKTIELFYTAEGTEIK
ncbi:MAG: hypothetical protein EPO57_05245 [Chitinophagaceae bacterium]|nr:MAG: hypothetical protein EPO57_05245 [Chitinophagaceae bacterium]